MQNRLKNPLTKLKQFGNDLNKILESKDEGKRSYSIEVTLTEGCNWNCEYCFEGDVKKTQKQHRLMSEPQVLLDTIDQILESKWFNDNFSFLNIDFWGGEPTLNIPLMKKILDHYQDNEKVSFFLYTNGSRIKKILPMLKQLTDKKTIIRQKILVQVSYDGNPIHDLRRVDYKGNATSDIAREAIELLATNNIPFQLKSTLMAKDFKHMFEAWKDINDLRKEYGTMINYAPTIDYYEVVFNDECYKDLERNLLEIARQELTSVDSVNDLTFSWFNRESKVVCGSGRTMCAIDINGNVHYCHGCIYKNHLKFANIYEDNNIFKGIEENYKELKSSVYDEECERCVATVCIRCNYLKYLNSSKGSFMDKFYDYKSQPDLCKYYKLIGKIDRAFHLALGRKL